MSWPHHLVHIHSMVSMTWKSLKELNHEETMYKLLVLLGGSESENRGCDVIEGLDWRGEITHPTTAREFDCPNGSM